jgi:3-hydroxyisobutyrate dehydrogenase-like beta-hydroxyacid dehydrogenase
MEITDKPAEEHHPAVGVVGVGLLGKAIAGRLMQQGVTVAGYDPVAFREDGLRVCNSLAELIQSSHIIILCLPNSDISSRVIADGQKLFCEHHTLMDTTTGNPEAMVAIGEKLRKQNVTYLEANVAGSSEQMREGAATLFVGGCAEAVELNASLLNALSTRWFHLGALGAASRFKLVHNMILGLNRLVLAEGLEFANSLGIDGGKALEILKQTPAFSTVMESKGERMVKGDFENPQARLSQHLKDVRLMIEAAKDSGAQIPLTTLHESLLEQSEHLGFGASDNSAIVQALKPEITKKDSA